MVFILVNNVYYCIFDVFGMQVVGFILIFLVVGFGFISNYVEVFVGLNIGGVIFVGYNLFMFDFVINGDFYIEFYISIDGGVIILNGRIMFLFFDFMVFIFVNV